MFIKSAGKNQGGGRNGKKKHYQPVVNNGLGNKLFAYFLMK